MGTSAAIRSCCGAHCAALSGMALPAPRPSPSMQRRSRASTAQSSGSVSTMAPAALAGQCAPARRIARTCAPWPSRESRRMLLQQSGCRAAAAAAVAAGEGGRPSALLLPALSDCARRALPSRAPHTRSRRGQRGGRGQPHGAGGPRAPAALQHDGQAQGAVPAPVARPGANVRVRRHRLRPQPHR